MAQFTVNPTRFDPYKNFKFQLLLGGKVVAGVSRVGMLKRTTEVVTFRTGGDPSTSRKSPGRTEYDAILLEQGVTYDTTFEVWAEKVWSLGNGLGSEASLADFRQNMTIQLLNEAGQLAMSYNVYNAWVSQYVAMPELDSNANAVAIRSITVENEGWERDISVQEPTEPSFTPPT